MRLPADLRERPLEPATLPALTALARACDETLPGVDAARLDGPGGAAGLGGALPRPGRWAQSPSTGRRSWRRSRSGRRTLTAFPARRRAAAARRGASRARVRAPVALARGHRGRDARARRGGDGRARLRARAAVDARGRARRALLRARAAGSATGAASGTRGSGSRSSATPGTCVRVLLGAFGDPGHAFPMLALGERARRARARGRHRDLEALARAGRGGRDDVLAGARVPGLPHARAAAEAVRGGGAWRRR